MDKMIDTIDDLIQDVKGYITLEPGWNGYSQCSDISSIVIKTAIDILNEVDYTPDLVIPTGRGTIQFEWCFTIDDAEVEIELEVYEGVIKYIIDYVDNDDDSINSVINIDSATPHFINMKILNKIK